MMHFKNKTYEGGLIDRFQINSFQDFLEEFEINIEHPQNLSFGASMPIIPPGAADISIKLIFRYSKYIELVIGREAMKYNSNVFYPKKDLVTDLIVYDNDGKEFFIHNIMLQSILLNDPEDSRIIVEFTAEHYEVSYNTKKEYEDVYE